MQVLGGKPWYAYATFDAPAKRRAHGPNRTTRPSGPSAWLVWLAFVAAGVVTVLGPAKGRPWAVRIESGVALAVAAVPAGLPAVVTVALAIGLQRMARRRVVVRRLAVLEALGHRILEMCRAGTGGDALNVNKVMADDGLRVIALASGPVEAATEAALNGLEFEGLVGLMDPPAAGVREAVARLQRAGVRPIMLTGDQRATAEAAARDLGVGTVFSRVTPEDKLTIVAGLQDNGEIVAMIGDGINDAAALRKADIGVAMGGRGTAVAQDAAAVALEDDRFETIVAALEEGRVISDNIGKVVFYLLSCNLAEVLVLVVAGLFGWPLALSPLQLLWTNLVIVTFPALALALEPGEADVMTRPPRDPHVAMLSRPFLSRVILFGGLIAGSTLAALLWGLVYAPAAATTMAFMTLMLTQALHLGNARSRPGVPSPAAARSNRYAVGALGLSLLLQMATVPVGPLSAALGVSPLTAGEWLVALLCSAAAAVAGRALGVWRLS